MKFKWHEYARSTQMQDLFDEAYKKHIMTYQGIRHMQHLPFKIKEDDGVYKAQVFSKSEHSISILVSENGNDNIQLNCFICNPYNDDNDCEFKSCSYHGQTK